MTASDAESWARLRLVQGESSAQKWELVSSLGHTTLTVGSNVDCTWVVREEGVRPIHFSLHWDGNLLRVADVYSAGDVRVDGTLLTSQWRPLMGRVRIDFGKAALVVETSSHQGRAGHPLDSTMPLELKPSDLKAAPGRSGSEAPRANAKETLIGVAPAILTSPSGAPPSYTPGVSSPSASPPAEPGAEPSRVARNIAGGSMKATLVGGIGVSSLPPGTVPPQSSPPGPGASPSVAPGLGVNPKAKPNATLMGFNVVDSLRGSVGTQPAAHVGGHGAPGYQGVKTSSSAPPGSGVPSRRMTKQGMVSQPPGVMPEAVAQVPVRPVTSAPGAMGPAGRGEGNERIGSAWQEMPESGPPVGAHTLRGVPGTEDAPPPERRGPRLGQSRFDINERLSDIPTNMRDPTTFESRKPRRGFPWRYVGVLVLTGVAYFAWLYLLDHM